jgi:hypothetical protein
MRWVRSGMRSAAGARGCIARPAAAAAAAAAPAARTPHPAPLAPAGAAGAAGVTRRCSKGVASDWAHQVAASVDGVKGHDVGAPRSDLDGDGVLLLLGHGDGGAARHCHGGGEDVVGDNVELRGG